MITLALLAAYAITLAFVLHLLAASKRREEATVLPESAPANRRRFQRARIVAPPQAAAMPEAHPDLGRLATTVGDTLDVERVAIVLSDVDEPGTGVVAACYGVPRLLGHRVPVLSEPATGLLTAAELAELGLRDGDPDEELWAVAQLPITGTDELLGALAVASRSEREFTGDDLCVLERLAREGAPQFDRRRHALIPRVMA